MAAVELTGIGLFAWLKEKLVMEEEELFGEFDFEQEKINTTNDSSIIFLSAVGMNPDFLYIK